VQRVGVIGVLLQRLAVVAQRPGTLPFQAPANRALVVRRRLGWRQPDRLGVIGDGVVVGAQAAMGHAAEEVSARLVGGGAYRLGEVGDGQVVIVVGAVGDAAVDERLRIVGLQPQRLGEV